MRRQLYILITTGITAITINAAPVETFFNGKDLTGWNAAKMSYWSVKDNTIIGHSAASIPRNQFLWSSEKVKDFLFTVDVKLTPNECNAGIQFRSVTHPGNEAFGYQADVGKGVWARLYHECGRGKLDWRDRGEAAVKPNEWNRYEILAVGDRVWTAVNGTLAVSVRDPKGEREGYIALQIHGGPPQTVYYRNPTLVHNPPIRLAGRNEAQLNVELINLGDDQKASSLVRTKPRGLVAVSAQLMTWPEKIAVADPGSKKDIWAQPEYSDSGWKAMALPTHFENAGLPGYDGVVWFRKTVDLPAGGVGRLELGAIDDMDVTWVNGKRVGGYEVPGHHYTLRNYNVPAGLLKAGKNVIAVRVMDHGAPGGIAGKAADMKLTVGKTVVPLAGEWRYKAGANLTALNAAVRPAKARTAANVPTERTAPFTSDFKLADDDVVVLMGGTNTVKQQQHGYLEALMTHAASGKQVYFRNMAWQADTVYRQQRPRNFGSHLSQIERVNASVLLLGFGQVEAMDGEEQIPAFVAAYEQLFNELAVQTRKVVLVTPFPFQKPATSHLPDLTRHNKAITAYAAAIAELAAKRGFICVDLSRVQVSTTPTGMHLTAAGHRQVAGVVVRELLGADSSEETGVTKAGVFNDVQLERLRQAILVKNELWLRHWRPANWGFVYGNRQTMPSSRDHRNHAVRWFPAEVDGILNMIERADDEITIVRSQKVR